MQLQNCVHIKTWDVSDAVGGKLTVVSSSVADLQSCQVVKEVLEIKGGQCRSEPWLSLVKPVK